MNAAVHALRIGFLAVVMVCLSTFYAALSLILSPISATIAWHASRLWSVNLLFFLGIRVSCKNLSSIDHTQPYIFIANHQSALDIPVLYSGLGQSVNFIAKKGLFQIPLFGWAMASVGHIQMDRGNAREARKSITRAGNTLRKHHRSLVLFPEGTRSVDGSVGEFKRGSFTLALEAGIPIVPVAIIGSRELLPRNTLQPRPGTIELRLGAPIHTQGLVTSDKAELSQKVRDAIVALMQN